MIHLELQRNKVKTLKTDQNTTSQAATNISKPSKGATHWLLDTLEVTESRITDNNCDKVIGNEQMTGQSNGIKCCSCEAWQAWSVQSQQCILLIEKKLIERESVLQQKFKSLLKEIQNRSQTLEQKIHEYELQKTKDKQIIQYLTNKIQQYHKEGQDNIQTQHSFSIIQPSNQLILNNKNDLSTPPKETDQCHNLRTVKKEKQFVCHLSQQTKDKKKVEVEDRNMGEFKKKLRYNMGESTKNLMKDDQVSEGNQKGEKDMKKYLDFGNNVGESLKIKINGMKNELVEPQASIQRDFQQSCSMLITNHNGQIAISNQTQKQTQNNQQQQQQKYQKPTQNYHQNQKLKQPNNWIQSLQYKQQNQNNQFSFQKNGHFSIKISEKELDSKFEENQEMEQQSQLFLNQSIRQQKSNERQNIRKQAFSNECKVRQSHSQTPSQSYVNTVNQQDFNQSRLKQNMTKNDKQSVKSNGNSENKRSQRELLSQFYSSDEKCGKGQKSISCFNQNSNVQCQNDVKYISKQSNDLQNKNPSNKTINNNQHSFTNSPQNNFNHCNSIHSFSNSPFNSKIYTEFQPHRRNQSCNEKYGKQQSSTSDISQRWKSMPQQQVRGGERIIGNVHEYNKKMMMQNKDRNSIFSQQTYAFIPKHRKEDSAYEDLPARQIEANSKYIGMIRHEDRQGFKTKTIQEKSQKQSISSLSNDDNSKSNDGMRRHHKIMTFNAGVESICKKGVGVNNGSSLINNTQQQELSCSKRNEGKIKSELSQTLGSIGKTTKFGESTNNTFKTIKLSNNVDSEKNSFFHKTAPYSLTRDMKNRNNQFLGIGDKVWQQSGEEASVSNWGNPQYGGERPTKKAMEGQDQRTMKFENQNLKSYNRVLLDKLAHSRPRLY